MQDRVRDWFARRTYDGWQWTASELVQKKQLSGTSVSVVLPALDEEATVGGIVAAIKRELVERVALVDEVIVMDSGSTDATAVVAAEAGARVVAASAVVPWMGARRGKGEALWKSLFVASGDIVVFVDADLRRFTPRFVVGLLGPLLTDRSLVYVKGAYDRPLMGASSSKPTGVGGRVTELLARPLINVHWPELSGFVQPLGGEYAGRRNALMKLPFPTGYGVEIALLVDLLHRHGLYSLGQVDLGRRVHSHQSDEGLSRMASEVLHTAQRRLGGASLRGDVLHQFRRGQGGSYDLVPWQVPTEERPPVATVLAELAADPREGATAQRQLSDDADPDDLGLLTG